MSIKLCYYPGSFDPWHAGHEDILLKSLAIFDTVAVIQAYNPSDYDV